jgi:hypothetical protein
MTFYALSVLLHYAFSTVDHPDHAIKAAACSPSPALGFNR